MDLFSAETGNVPVWVELLSTDTESPGSPRTLETKGRPWGQGRVEWKTEDPAGGAGGGGAMLLPGQSARDSTHSPLWMELLSTDTEIAQTLLF